MDIWIWLGKKQGWGARTHGACAPGLTVSGPPPSELSARGSTLRACIVGKIRVRSTCPVRLCRFSLLLIYEVKLSGIYLANIRQEAIPSERHTDHTILILRWQFCLKNVQKKCHGIFKNCHPPTHINATLGVRKCNLAGERSPARSVLNYFLFRFSFP